MSDELVKSAEPIATRRNAQHEPAVRPETPTPADKGTHVILDVLQHLEGAYEVEAGTGEILVSALKNLTLSPRSTRAAVY